LRSCLLQERSRYEWSQRLNLLLSSTSAQAQASLRSARLQEPYRHEVLLSPLSEENQRSISGLRFTMGHLQQAFYSSSSILLRSFQQTSWRDGSSNSDWARASSQRRSQASVGKIQPLPSMLQLQRVSVRDRGRRIRKATSAMSLSFSPFRV